MAEFADRLRAVLKLVKVDVKPGSKWHPVSSAWLRRAQVHAGLEEAHVEDSREPPGMLDNSDIADPIFPMCLRRSASEGVDFVWVPANAFRGLVKLYGVFEGQDPLEREAITDEATFDTKIEAYPQLCKLYVCSMLSRGEPMSTAPLQGLHRRSSTMAAVKQWALKATTSGPEPIWKEMSADQVRLWSRSQPPEELAEAGMPTTPGPWRLVDPEAALEVVAANDHFTDLLLEKFGKCGWPRGNVVKPGQTGVAAIDTAEAAAAGEPGAAPFDEAAWRAGLGVGSRLDAMDTTGQWYEAEVAAAEGDDLTIRFRAWVGTKFNEHIARGSPCLQPAWSRVRNFRSFLPGDNVQVFVRFGDSSALWADAVVIGTTAAQVKLRLASPEVTESLLLDKDDPHICPPGIHASVRNRPCTPLAATTGRFTPPPAGAAAGRQLVVVDAAAPAAAAESADATPLHPASLSSSSSSSSSSTAMVRHSRYGLVHKVPGIDDGGVEPEAEAEVYTSMAGRYYGGGRSSAAPAAPGVCGLQNLGNTCFMNSMLQCLSNSEPLARYFLDERRWKRDLNFDNPLGFKGGLASAYAKLMRAMWKGGLGSVAPSQVKEVVSRNAPQFRGYQQHDSQELMSYILDGLHEDCNLVLDKKATEKVESDGRPDAVVAAEAWATHEMRNQSAVQTIFGGQLRSHIQCNTCRNVSLTFDPFTSLSVPIPVPDRVKRVCTVVPHGPGMPTRPTFYPRSELTYVEFEQASRSCRSFAVEDPAAGFGSPQAADAAGVRGVDDPAARCEFGWAKVANKLDRHNRVLQFVHPDEPIRNVADEDFIFSFILPGRPVSQWEKDCLPWTEEEELGGAGAAGAPTPASSSSAAAAAAASTKALLAGAGAERSGSAGVPTRVRHPAGALLISLTTELPGAAAAQERSYEFPHVVYLPHVARLEASGGNQEAAFAAPFDADARPSQRAVMGAVWDQVRRHVAPSFVASYSAEAPPYSAFLVPARAEPVSGDTSDHRNKTFTGADFAKVGDEGVIALDPRSDAPIPVGGTECARYILRVRFNASGSGAASTVVVATRGEYGADTQEFRDSYGRRDRKGAGAITLHDCMDAYVQREQLGQDDKWYCPKCKDFVRAYKKFDLFTVGEVLIVQLKRFRFSNVHTSHYWGTSARRDKISELVDFPTENLDLSSFIMGPQPGPHIFDLYAVSEHSGGLGGGHYTATGRNWLNGRWYDFNDSFVRPARSAQDAVNASSYVLFFRRRGGAPLRVPLPRHVQPDGSLNAGDPEVARALADAAALRKELEDEKAAGGSA
ncbi:hypothetical protein FNF27_06316 [Cafeteria roenbergensis]|uniref:Uncharacterized protein n=2 Tax=Cafeteria roenbergensis TaxID=33653 RepID=A0A5A8E0U4_CAFRO|nr:hypothetical protein FNF27_06316 [Cafeteria roenbergensis]